MPNVELEIVDYNIPKIEEVSQELVTLFAQFSKDPQTVDWIAKGLPKLKNDIRNRKPEVTTFTSSAIELRFSGFPKRPIAINQGDKMLLRFQEPKFQIEEKTTELSPDMEEYILGSVGGITKRMHVMYLMDVFQPPLTLVFPNNIYANVERIFVENMPDFGQIAG